MIAAQFHRYTFKAGKWLVRIYPDPKWKAGQKDRKGIAVDQTEIVDMFHGEALIFTGSGLTAYENAVECAEHWQQTGYVPRLDGSTVGADHQQSARSTRAIRQAMIKARRDRLSGSSPEQPELFELQ